MEKLEKLLRPSKQLPRNDEVARQLDEAILDYQKLKGKRRVALAKIKQYAPKVGDNDQ